LYLRRWPLASAIALLQVPVGGVRVVRREGYSAHSACSGRPEWPRALVDASRLGKDRELLTVLVCLVGSVSGRPLLILSRPVLSCPVLSWLGAGTRVAAIESQAEQ
jgi:hypothetical protein